MESGKSEEGGEKGRRKRRMGDEGKDVVEKAQGTEQMGVVESRTGL